MVVRASRMTSTTARDEYDDICFSLCFMAFSGYQVKERKQENPYQVNKVPVKGAVLKHQVLSTVYTARPHPHHCNRQQHHSYQHMQCMKAGHHVVEAEKQELTV